MKVQKVSFTTKFLKEVILIRIISLDAEETIFYKNLIHLLMMIDSEVLFVTFVENIFIVKMAIIIVIKDVTGILVQSVSNKTYLRFKPGNC